MGKTKNQVGKIIENQNKLFEKLAQNSFNAAGVFTPDTKMSDEALTVFKSFVEKQQELTTELFKPANFTQPFEKLPELTGKMIEAQLDYFGKCTGLFDSFFQKMEPEVLEATSKKMFEIYRDSAQAIKETAEANSKIAEEIFA